MFAKLVRTVSQRARYRFNQVVEAKRLNVCSYVEKCAELKKNS